MSIVFEITHLIRNLEQFIRVSRKEPIKKRFSYSEFNALNKYYVDKILEHVYLLFSLKRHFFSEHLFRLRFNFFSVCCGLHEFYVVSFIVHNLIRRNSTYIVLYSTDSMRVCCCAIFISPNLNHIMRR